jgi:hypothetical protein
MMDILKAFLIVAAAMALILLTYNVAAGALDKSYANQDRLISVNKLEHLNNENQ